MAEKPRVLVSACLLGVKCRYDGAGQRLESLDRLLERAVCVPICPEQLGGLPTPRTPSERRGARVVSREGADVTDAFERGAAQAVQIAELTGARRALLKARSPSCGVGEIYDGTFTGKRVPGDGVAAEALSRAGVAVYSEARLDALINDLEGDYR